PFDAAASMASTAAAAVTSSSYSRVPEEAATRQSRPATEDTQLLTGKKKTVATKLQSKVAKSLPSAHSAVQTALEVGVANVPVLGAVTSGALSAGKAAQ